MIGSSLDFPCLYVARGFLCVVGQAEPEIHQNHPLFSKSMLKKTIPNKTQVSTCVVTETGTARVGSVFHIFYWSRSLQRARALQKSFFDWSPASCRFVWFVVDRKLWRFCLAEAPIKIASVRIFLSLILLEFTL